MKTFSVFLKRKVVNLFLGILMVVSFTLEAQTIKEYDGKQFVQRGLKWYQKEGKKEYEVNSSVITVKWKSNVTTSQKNVLLNKSGAKVLRSNKLGFVDLKISSPGDVLQIVNSLKNSEFIESAEVNTFGRYITNPNDTYFYSQWYLEQETECDIDMVSAWTLSKGSSSVLVGVLDSGTDWTHPDLSSSIWTNSGEDAWSNSNNPSTGNGIDDDDNGLEDDWKGWDFYNIDNDSRGTNGHGTQTAGLISARTNNGIGIAGVAGGWNSESGVKMLILGVGDDIPDESVLDDAILYAAENGVKVITMSLEVSQSSAIDSALAAAYNTYGCFIVCAAGNDGDSVSYPAKNQYVVAVSATDLSDVIASFSNIGSQISVSAPGVDIITTNLNSTYITEDGTSLSAPIVSGIAALLFSINSNLTNAETRKIIESTAEPKGAPGKDIYYGFGRVNAYFAAMAVAGPRNFRVTSPNNNYVTLAWNGLQPTSVVQYYEISRNINNWGWSVIATTTNTYYTDNEFEKAKEESDNAQYRIRSKTVDNIYSIYSDIITVEGISYWQQKASVAINEVPSVFSLKQNYPNPFNPSTEISYDIPEPSNVALQVFNSIGQQVAKYNSYHSEGGTYSIKWNANDLSNGVYYVRMQAGKYSAIKKMLLTK